MTRTTFSRRSLAALLATASLLPGCTDGGAAGGGNGEGAGDAANGDPECECRGEDCESLTGGQPIPRRFTLPVPLFAPDSAWNQRADEAAVLPESDEQILVLYRVLLGDSTSVQPPVDSLWPFMDVNYDAFSIPIFLAGDGEQDVRIRDYDGVLGYPHEKFATADQLGGPVTVPDTAGTIRPAGPTGADSDGHLVLYDPESSRAYDFWGCTTVLDPDGESLGGGQPASAVLEAGAVDFFDLNGDGTNPDGLWSARAVGTALLAGLIVAEDVEGGAIEHALACAIPGPRNTATDPTEPVASDYVYPAATAESEYYNTDPRALAPGQRLRLKQTIVDEEGQPIDEEDLAPITRMFLAALRTYGAYVVDNAGGFTFYAEDIHTADPDLSDEEVNALVGRPPDTPFSPCKTRWQVLMETLNEDLGRVPLASGSWWEYGPDGRDPATATYGIANFEVVENAAVPID
jgi:hypothetical protein